MAITLRNVKGSALTFNEMDNNFITLSGMTGGGVAEIETITYSELYDKVVGSTLVPLQWYRLTDYKSVNFINGLGIAYNNPIPVDPNFNPQQIHTGDTEVLLVQAISESEISPIAYSQDFEGEIVEYRPYTNKLGLPFQLNNGQVLPNSQVVSGFDLQWDGDNVFFEMPQDYPLLYGYVFYINSSFDGGNYRVSQAYSPLTPNPKLVFVEYPDAPNKVTNIRIENNGSKIVLLDLVEQDFLDYDLDSLYVFTFYALGDAYGEVVRRIDTFKDIDVPFDFRGIKYRRFECELLGYINSISYTATGSTATDGNYIILSTNYITDTVQGENARFKVTVIGGSVTDVQIDRQGRLYANGDTFTIDGNEIGGVSVDDDVVITIGVDSYIDYWGQGDVFNGATTTGNYLDFPVFNYNNSDVFSINWLKTPSLGDFADNNVIFEEINSLEIKGLAYNNTIFQLTDNIIGIEFQNNSLNTVTNNIIGDYFYNNIVYFLYNNIISNEFFNNTINSFGRNRVDTSFNDNIVNNNFNFSIIGHSFEDNTLLNDFSGNIIGNSFFGNKIGSGYSNMIGNNFYDNTIGVNFHDNTIGNSLNNNKISNEFFNNTIGHYFNDNTIGNDFAYNKIGHYFNENTIGDGFGFGGSTSQGNVIGNYFYNNSIGEYFYNNTIVDQFYANTIGDNFQLNNVKASVTFTDFTATPATYVYGAYNCDIFRRSDFDLRLSYYDNSDVLNIDDITN